MRLWSGGSAFASYAEGLVSSSTCSETFCCVKEIVFVLSENTDILNLFFICLKKIWLNESETVTLMVQSEYLQQN
jgi:hypothetical protein